MKETFRIGGALCLGMFIILGAFWVRNRDSEAVSNGVVVVPAPERNPIVTRDSDGDGVEDWEESVIERTFARISTPTSTTLGDEDTGPYEEPTTLTGRFSEAFLQDYLQGKMAGVDFSDPSELVGNAVTAIESNTRSKQYSKLDIIRIPTTPESLYVYGNEISAVMQKHSIDNENEMVILERALTAEDPELLKPLQPIREVYEKIVRDALITPVPEMLANEHLAFINASEAIKTDIAAMELAFTDPLYSLARIRKYQEDATNLYNALIGMAEVIQKEAVEYRNDEPGAFFYLFEL